MCRVLFTMLFCIFCISISSCRKSHKDKREISNSIIENESLRGRNVRNKDNRRGHSSDENDRIVVIEKGQDDSVDNDNPSVTPVSTEKRVTFWSVNSQDNIKMLQDACDYNVPKTKGFANKLAGKANYSDGHFNIEQLCEIFDYCFTKWRYVNDPKGGEYLAKASESITCSLTGDCDDFAVLVSSCMLAIGGDICIVTANNGSEGHAYSEVDISHMNEKHVKEYIKKRFTNYSISNIVIRKYKGYKWLNLDWSAGYPGGPKYNSYQKNYYYCINGVWIYE